MPTTTTAVVVVVAKVSAVRLSFPSLVNDLSISAACYVVWCDFCTYYDGGDDGGVHAPQLNCCARAFSMMRCTRVQCIALQHVSARINLSRSLPDHTTHTRTYTQTQTE